MKLPFSRTVELHRKDQFDLEGSTIIAAHVSTPNRSTRVFAILKLGDSWLVSLNRPANWLGCLLGVR